MKILYIDDDQTMRKIVKHIVDVIGAELLEAEDGRGGLRLLEDIDGKVDLILLDWIMPEMNGMEFLQAAKADGRFKEIPVIMLTGVTQKEKMIDAIRAGAKQYITKPFTSEELLTKLVQALGLDSLEML